MWGIARNRRTPLGFRAAGCFGSGFRVAEYDTSRRSFQIPVAKGYRACGSGFGVQGSEAPRP